MDICFICSEPIQHEDEYTLVRRLLNFVLSAFLVARTGAATMSVLPPKAREYLSLAFSDDEVGLVEIDGVDPH